jgi:DNA-binding MarR family transcriptional regulator
VEAADIARLRVAIARLARRLRTSSGGGITPSQLSVLFTVEARGPLTPGELADREGVRPPTITRIVAYLEDEGMLSRRPGEDRRTSLVEVTPQARETLADIRVKRDAWLTERLGKLSGEDLECVTTALPVFERLLLMDDEAAGAPPPPPPTAE